MAFPLSGGSCSVASPSHHHGRFTDRGRLGRLAHHPPAFDAWSPVLFSRKSTFQLNHATPLAVALQESVSAVTSPQELPLDQHSMTQEQQTGAGAARGHFNKSVWVNPKRARPVWVNPKGSRAARPREQLARDRYLHLAKVGQILSSLPSPTDEDIANTLAAATNLVSPSERDAVIVLNNIKNSSTALACLRWFLPRVQEINGSVTLYNVTLKVMRRCRDWESAESLMSEMLLKGVKPNNSTFSTMISCAGLCYRPEKALELFERMPELGCKPDSFTYGTVINSCGQSGNYDMALSLFERARTERCMDAINFSSIIKVHARSGNVDGALEAFEEMKALGLKPNLVIYNMLLEAMGREDRPWKLKTIHKEMVDRGISPCSKTYASLLLGYCRARYADEALNLYKEMKEKGLNFNVYLYNSLLGMCAYMELVDEAVEIFKSMRSSPNECKPDRWTFSSLMAIYALNGQVSEAESILNQMKEAGVEPNIVILTSLVHCYGKAKQTDSVVKTFDSLEELGIVPDFQFCGCLLDVLIQTPEVDRAKVVDCIDRANPKLGQLVKHVLNEEFDNDRFRSEAAGLLIDIGNEVKKPCCNYLIDVCINMGFLERACILFDLALQHGIFSSVQSKTSTQWSLHVNSLSSGAAVTALHVWMNDLSKAMKDGEGLPSLLGIHTGPGKRRPERRLAVMLQSYFKELNAPFHEMSDNRGWFLTTKVAAESWLESRALEMADSSAKMPR